MQTLLRRSEDVALAVAVRCNNCSAQTEVGRTIRKRPWRPRRVKIKRRRLKKRGHVVDADITYIASWDPGEAKILHKGRRPRYLKRRLTLKKQQVGEVDAPWHPGELWNIMEEEEGKF